MSNKPILSNRIIFWLSVTILFFGFLFIIHDMLLPFILGILVAYFLDPAADKLEKWGCGRALATTIITASFFALISILIITLSPILIKQIIGLIEDVPNYISTLRNILLVQVEKLPIAIDVENSLDTDTIFGQLSTDGKAIALKVLKSGMAIINILSLLFITPVVAFYLLRDWDKLVDKIDNLLPRKHAKVIRTQLHKIDETLAGFLRGQINVMILLGIFYAVALLIAGLKYAVIIGLISGFLIIIPYLGAIIGAIFSIGIAFVQFDDWNSIAAIAIIYVIGQILEGSVLTPKLVGGKVGLHPVWIIFGMLAGASMFGFVGILIAVPVTAIIGVLVRFSLEEYKESSLYKGK